MNARIVLAAVGVALLLSGCEQQQKSGTKPNTAAAPGDNKPLIPEPGGPPTAASHIKRGKERQINQNDMRQLALSFQQIKLQGGNRAVTKDELKAEIARDMPRLWQGIEKGDIVVNYNCDGSSNSVLAYEKNADLNGNHLVTMGDGSTSLVPSAKLSQITPRQ